MFHSDDTVVERTFGHCNVLVLAKLSGMQPDHL